MSPRDFLVRLLGVKFALRITSSGSSRNCGPVADKPRRPTVGRRRPPPASRSLFWTLVLIAFVLGFVAFDLDLDLLRRGLFGNRGG